MRWNREALCAGVCRLFIWSVSIMALLGPPQGASAQDGGTNPEGKVLTGFVQN